MQRIHATRSCYIVVLVASIISSRAGTADLAPLLGSAYYHGTPSTADKATSDTGSVRIQSASGASQTSPCNSDASCQVLCPTSDITAAQPPLSTTAAQQQVLFHPTLMSLCLLHNLCIYNV